MQLISYNISFCTCKMVNLKSFAYKILWQQACEIHIFLSCLVLNVLRLVNVSICILQTIIRSYTRHFTTLWPTEHLQVYYPSLDSGSVQDISQHSDHLNISRSTVLPLIQDMYKIFHNTLTTWTPPGILSSPWLHICRPAQLDDIYLSSGTPRTDRPRLQGHGCWACLLPTGRLLLPTAHQAGTYGWRMWETSIIGCWCW